MKAFVRTAPLLAMAALTACGQMNNEVRDRGATPLTYPSPGNEPVITLSGTLVDAGCRNRTALNMSLPGVPFKSALPAETKTEAQAATQMRSGQPFVNPNQPAQQQAPTTTVNGITVDSKTLATERSEVLEHQVPDLFSRQMDPTCAITGATHAFAVVLGNNGRMLNFDDGGNTFATVAIQATPQGKQMLDGTGGGLKPQVAIRGRIRNDKVVVQSLKLSK